MVQLYLELYGLFTFRIHYVFSGMGVCKLQGMRAKYCRAIIKEISPQGKHTVTLILHSHYLLQGFKIRCTMGLWGISLNKKTIKGNAKVPFIMVIFKRILWEWKICRRIHFHVETYRYGSTIKLTRIFYLGKSQQYLSTKQVFCLGFIFRDQLIR